MNNELMHYGVLGMKWGHRKAKTATSGSTAKTSKNARKQRKQKIKSEYKKLQKNASIGDRLLYSDGTRRLAAKYIVDNNMSMTEARSKANEVAMRNTAIFLAVYGGIGMATLYKNNH